ncbi:hypothetical protein HDU96_007599 [Phlyctochytrium bullatum]|nr:hypothetical protein HDU96_007599 [Phlyctochytrium bullatum]
MHVQTLFNSLFAVAALVTLASTAPIFGPDTPNALSRREANAAPAALPVAVPAPAIVARSPAPAAPKAAKKGAAKKAKAKGKGKARKGKARKGKARKGKVKKAKGKAKKVARREVVEEVAEVEVPLEEAEVVADEVEVERRFITDIDVEEAAEVAEVTAETDALAGDEAESDD